MLKNVIFTALSLTAIVASHTIQASDQAPAEPATAQTIPANPDNEAAKQPAPTPQPNNDKLFDYRYCLELKTDREIAECRYKKK